ncbi:hypothetical protein P4G58_15845 [Lactiplantibacillus plantarum]|uniref:hypothetical protein n=3 Tax=Lactiplantibacillus plantarum TaxID=1590 RepID=UPI0027389773|nr:hypothetical protein [Lactiplantibacillus plantarum]MDP4440978.1 hypothetical protein [Lactiplantibacillus plantarum]
MDFSNMSEFDDLSNVFKDSQFDFLNDSFIRVDPNMLFDDPELDFLNFYLGREINLAGELIFTGFEAIVDDQPILKNKEDFSFLNESGPFIFLVDTSIAFERLNKVILLFLLYIKDHEQFSAFFNAKEKKDIKNSMDNGISEALYGHSTMKVVEHITDLDQTLLELSREEKNLLSQFDKFYINFRYGRFSPKTKTYYEETVMVQEILSKIDNKDKDHALEILGKRIRGLAAKYYAVVQTLTLKLNIFSDELHSDSDAYYVYFQNEDLGPYHMSLFDVFTLKRFARQEIIYALIYNKLKGKKDKDQCLVKPIDLDDIDLTNVLKYGKDNFSLNSIEEWLTDIFVEDNYDKRWDSYDDSRKNKAIKKMINERENTIAAFLTFKSN